VGEPEIVAILGSKSTEASKSEEQLQIAITVEVEGGSDAGERLLLSFKRSSWSATR
jgi:hypothetical protein